MPQPTVTSYPARRFPLVALAGAATLAATAIFLSSGGTVPLSGKDSRTTGAPARSDTQGKAGKQDPSELSTSTPLVAAPSSERSDITTADARPEGLAILESHLGPSIGLMSPEDLERAKLYITPLIDASFAELRAFQSANEGQPYDVQTAATEADLLRTAMLWQAIEDAAENGNYWLGDHHPSQLPGGSGSIFFQALSVTVSGKPATAVFFVDNSLASGSQYLEVEKYYSKQMQVWLQEACHRFNSLPDDERRALHQRVVQSKGGRMPADLRDRIPFGTFIDKTTLIMRVR